MKKNIILIVILMASITNTLQAEKFSYQLSFPEAQAHYVNVELNITNNQEEIVLKLPVWAPGSYLVREFARHVEGFEAKSTNGQLQYSKINKNTWLIKNPSKQAVKVNYRVYAFELTVRTSFIDESHAYLNGSNIFMYVDGVKDASYEVSILPKSDWKQVSCALPMEKGNIIKYFAENYDILADSPIEIGNHKIIEFTAQGVKHTVAMVGPANYEEERIKKDFIKIVDEATSIFGTHPCKNYLFIVHNVPSGGGGLEHLNSTTVQVQRFAYANENTYQSFLGLIAHEYFHLWNVKRLRPAVLGPFNYNEENYSSMLWVSEGFTAFYDNWIVRRAGFTSPEKYLDIIANEYSTQTNLPGDKVQSLAEASFDAWIKYYRRNENSNNSQVSYYDKGSIVASLLNILIIEHSGAKQNLDDLMRWMYNEYYIKQNRGFSDEEFKKAAEKFTGQNLDEFYSKYINGTDAIPYESFLGKLGLKLTNINATKNELYLGFSSTVTNGKTIINGVSKGSPAYTVGLNVNDEIIAIDNYRVDDLAKLLSTRKIGDKMNLTISRDGVLRSIEITATKNTQVKYKIEILAEQTKEQEAAYKKWIR